MESKTLVTIDPSQYEPESKSLAVITPQNEDAALLFLVKVKGNIRQLESEKETACRPLMDSIEATRSPFLKAIKAFESLKKVVEDGLSNYRRQQQVAREAEQRRLLEEHNRLQRLADEKAEKSMQSLEASRSERDRLMAWMDAEHSSSEHSQLLIEIEAINKVIAKQEAKVEKAVVAQQTVAPPTVVEQVQKTVTSLDGSKTTFMEETDWAFANGVPKDEVFYRDDPRFKNLDDRHFKFDPTTMNKRVKSGDKTISGIVLFKKPKTMTRGAKS